MPSKRPSPLEDPPSASSSEGEEEEEEEMEEEEEDEEDDIADPKSPMNMKKQQATKPEPTPSPGPQTQSSTSSSEDEDEESDSDSEPSPPKSSRPSRSADPDIKPISSKPMDDTLKPKKPATTAIPTKSSAVLKRPIETDKAEKDSKRKKKKVSDVEEEDLHHEETSKKPGDDPKKLFQRLWSDEDEIVMLKGMINYMKKGLNPTADMNAFLDFIKKSLHVDVNRGQLNNKIQRLKKKYLNNSRRAKNGEDPTFSKPHELKSYQLSKKIWGGEEEAKEEGVEVNNVGASITTDEKKSKSPKTGNELPSSVPESSALQKLSLELAVEAEEDQNWSLYPCLIESLHFGKNVSMHTPIFGEKLAKEGLRLIGSSKVNELEQRWRKVKITEAKAYLERVDLVRDQTKLLLDALESSKS